MYRYGNGHVPAGRQPLGGRRHNSFLGTRSKQSILACFLLLPTMWRSRSSWPWVPALFRESMAILTKKLFCRSRRTRICSGFWVCGYDDSKPPFNPSSMVHFRKRLTPEILAEINEMVIRAADKEDDQNYNNSGGNGNSGTMIEVRDYQDERERVEVERKFSLRKRKCGMDLVTAKLEDTAAHVIALSILLLNLRKIQYVFYNFWLGCTAFGNRAKN